MSCFVVGGRIDQAHHENKAKKSLEETVQFEEAIKMAMSLIDQKDTLVVVTADHSHPFSLTGFTMRGNPILGKIGFQIKTLSHNYHIPNLKKYIIIIHVYNGIGSTFCRFG